MSIEVGLGSREPTLPDRKCYRCGKLADDGRAVRLYSAVADRFDLLLGDFELQELLRTEANAVAVGIVGVGTFGLGALAVDLRILALSLGLGTLLLRSSFGQGDENGLRRRCLANDDFHDLDVDTLVLDELSHLADDNMLDFAEDVLAGRIELAGGECCHGGLRHFISHRGAKQLLQVLVVPVRPERFVQVRGFAGDRLHLDIGVEVDRDVVDGDGAVLGVVELLRVLDRAGVIHDGVGRVEQPLGASGVWLGTNPTIVEDGEERLVDDHCFISCFDLHPVRDQPHDRQEEKKDNAEGDIQPSPRRDADVHIVSHLVKTPVFCEEPTAKNKAIPHYNNIKIIKVNYENRSPSHQYLF